MASWNLTYKGTEVLTPEEWNRVIDALNELDARTGKIRGGIATFSGDGVTKDFEITHDLGEVPTVVMIGEASEDAEDFKYWEADEEKVIIHFWTAPPEGTDNVKLWYLIMKL